MRTAFFIFLFFLQEMPVVSFCQSKPKFEQLPATTQAGFKQVAAKYDTGLVNYLSVEKDLKKSGLDLSNMPIEDAVMMLFALISDDARKDMQEMLKEMDATRQKRNALREQEELMKAALDSLKNLAKNKYRPDSVALKKQINDRAIKLQDHTKAVKLAMTADDKAALKLAAIERHMRSAQEQFNLLNAKINGKGSKQ